MFNRATLMAKVNEEDFSSANEMLNQAGEGEFHPGTGGLLYALAQSDFLNNALSHNNSDAKALLGNVFKKTKLSFKQNKKPDETPLILAARLGYRATTKELLNLLKANHKKKLIKFCLKADQDHKTVLHYAIIHCDHASIQILCGMDTDHLLFFKRDKNDLFSLALAIDQYKKNPNDLTISICNQLYFSLPAGFWRGQAVEQRINLGFWTFAKPLWRYALRYCAKRDEDGMVTGPDLNFIDLVNQVVEEGGLFVMGLKVTWGLIDDYSKSYSGTPGALLKTARQTLAVGLPGRTLGQTTVNKTLAKNREFMSRARLENGDYTLVNLMVDPEIPANIEHLDQAKQYIALFEGNLFYLSKANANENRKVREIKVGELDEKDEKYFVALVDRIQTIPGEVVAAADDLKNIIAVVPMLVSEVMPTRMTNIKGKNTGMTLFSNYTPAKSPSTLKPTSRVPAGDDVAMPLESRVIRRRAYSSSSSDSE